MTTQHRTGAGVGLPSKPVKNYVWKKINTGEIWRTFEQRTDGLTGMLSEDAPLVLQIC